MSNLGLNAKTVRNNNSSRFGKSMELQFDQSCRITGAAIRTTFKEICHISHLAPQIITFIAGPAATPPNSAPTASRAKEKEIERRKTEVEGKIQAHIGCVEGETKRLAQIYRLWYPSSVIFVDKYGATGSSVLAITEGSQPSIWDLRVKENGGCVHRIMGSVGDLLYAVAMSSSGNIAASGADCTVTVYDPRRWSALSRWLHCSKYEITGLNFSSIDPDYIDVQGVDYEVRYGQWRESKTSFSF